MDAMIWLAAANMLGFRKGILPYESRQAKEEEESQS